MICFKFTSGNHLRILLAQYMCVGVPIRKHTWKVVSPTAPLFSTSQQCLVNISGWVS